jgi:hypothetical protein
MDNKLLKFTGRFVYQSGKLILRVFFILLGGLFTGAGRMIDAAVTNQSNHEDDYDELQSGEFDRWGGPVTSKTKFKDWMY